MWLVLIAVSRPWPRERMIQPRSKEKHTLAYLRRMPLDELKIDKAFVQNMLDNKADVQIVRSVIDLAHNFELEAVAEGVENLATLEMLARLDCDVIQGFHYARPMPLAQVPAWWAARDG